MAWAKEGLASWGDGEVEYVIGERALIACWSVESGSGELIVVVGVQRQACEKRVLVIVIKGPEMVVAIIDYHRPSSSQTSTTTW